MKGKNFSPHIRNLESYITYLSMISGFEVYNIGRARIVFNGFNDSLFNYVFCEDDIEKDNVKEVISFLKTKGWEMTWPVEANFHKLRALLKDNGLSRVSNPKKAYLDLDNFYFMPEEKLDLQFIEVKHLDEVKMFDSIASDIFYHREGMVTECLKGLEHRNDEFLRAFIVKLDDQIVGLCSEFIDGDNAGFYADGVFKNFRNRRIGSHMVAKRVEIAKKSGCKFVIAHCMSKSVGLYERLGFKMKGTLYLYVSLPNGK